MGVFSNKIDREELKPGDHIYTWRQAYIYAHHGIYVGDGMVIHFTRGGGQEIGTGTVLDRFLCSSSTANATGSPCPKCGDQTKTDGVISSCLDCFLSGDSLYLFEYGVSLAFFLAKARGGTCTLAVSDPPEDVLHRASFLLENGFGGYNIFKNNCEDFAIYCKTGLLICTSISVGRSGQAASCLAAASAVVSTSLRFMTTSFSGLAAVRSGMYCVSRLVSDIGMRRDVSKVAVEMLIASPVSREKRKKEMGVFSNKIDREELKPGDHIYSWRQAYIYAHHGIYVGDGMVIHFTRGGGQEIGTGTVLDRFLCSSSTANTTGSPCPKCGDQAKTDGVISSCLDCFLSGDSLYLFEYGVSPALFLAKARGGTCTTAVSDPPEVVLHRASFLLENGFGGYNIFKNNCEDFAIYCKTGLGRSGQAASCLAAASAVVSTPLRFMTTSFGGLAAVGYGMYCVSRLVSDIGMRRDVSKVAVEMLIASPVSDEPQRLIASPVSDEPQRLIASAGLDEQEKTTQMIKED